MFINNNSRFCYLRIWKISSTNIFRRMLICERKYKNWNYIDNELKSESESESDSDSDSNIDVEE